MGELMKDKRCFSKICYVDSRLYSVWPVKSFL